MWSKKATVKLFVSFKHKNILLLILIYLSQVAAVRPTSGHRYKEFSNGYM
jgi:hypothetical protein